MSDEQDWTEYKIVVYVKYDRNATSISNLEYEIEMMVQEYDPEAIKLEFMKGGHGY